MRGYNKVILIGHLGRDPDMRSTQSGVRVANFSLATSEKFKGRDGKMKEQTEWHRVVAWDKLAEIVEQYISKGDPVMIEGKLQTRDWEDKDGNQRRTTEIVAKELRMLGSKREGGSARDDGPPPSDDVPF